MDSRLEDNKEAETREEEDINITNSWSSYEII
jgi:hypothetical protein